MGSVNIDKLLEKYLEAETTLAEEQQLQAYFEQEEVAPHLEEYRPMFQYFTSARQERYTKPVPLNTRRNNNYMRWISVAAVAVIAIGVYFGGNFKSGGVDNGEAYTQEELESAQKALELLASNFNKGTQQVSYLSEFEKNTNKFLIKK